jgi:hypothetical protein
MKPGTGLTGTNLNDHNGLPQATNLGVGSSIFSGRAILFIQAFGLLRRAMVPSDGAEIRRDEIGRAFIAIY